MRAVKAVYAGQSSWSNGSSMLAIGKSPHSDAYSSPSADALSCVACDDGCAAEAAETVPEGGKPRCENGSPPRAVATAGPVHHERARV